MGYGTLCCLLMNLLNSELPLVAQLVKNPPAIAMQETQARSLGAEDPLEKEMAIHSSILGGNPKDRRAWQATYSSWGRKELDMI